VHSCPSHSTAYTSHQLLKKGHPVILKKLLQVKYILAVCDQKILALEQTADEEKKSTMIRTATILIKNI
jgi:hypothetical protein